MWGIPEKKLTHTKIQRTPFLNKIQFLLLFTVYNAAIAVVSGAALAAFGTGLEAVSPVESGALAPLAAKITVFGKSTVLFPVYTAPKAVFSASVQGYHFMAPKVAIVANQIFTEVIIPAAIASKYYFHIALINSIYAYHTWIIPTASKLLLKLQK